MTRLPQRGTCKPMSLMPNGTCKRSSSWWQVWALWYRGRTKKTYATVYQNHRLRWKTNLWSRSYRPTRRDKRPAEISDRKVWGCWDRFRTSRIKLYKNYCFHHTSRYYLRSNGHRTGSWEWHNWLTIINGKENRDRRVSQSNREED